MIRKHFFDNRLSVDECGNIVLEMNARARRAAEILEEMSLEKAINAVKIMIELEVYEDIVEILRHVNTNRLNRIFEALTQSEKNQLFPYLTPEIISRAWI